jgi:hypothetical protein
LTQVFVPSHVPLARQWPVVPARQHPLERQSLDDEHPQVPAQRVPSIEPAQSLLEVQPHAEPVHTGP